MKNSKSLKVKRFVLFMFATFLCFFIAQIGAGFLNHKPYYADADKASIVGNEIHYYNNDGETEVVDIDALCDEIISGLLPPEPEPVEYVLTRTEVEDGVYNMSFLPAPNKEWTKYPASFFLIS